MTMLPAPRHDLARLDLKKFGLVKRACSARRSFSSTALRLPAVLDFEADQPRQERRRKQWPDHRFEIGKVARQRIDRRDVAVTDSGQRREAEIEQRRAGTVFGADWRQAVKGIRNQRSQKPIEGEEQ